MPYITPEPPSPAPTPGGGRRPNPLVSGCYGGGTRGFRHCRWSGAMWGRLGCSRAVKYAGGCGWWGVGGFGQLFFKVYFIFTVFCELSQMMPLLVRPHTWAYITNIACMGLLDYIMTLITNIKHRKPGPHHPDLPQTHHHSTNLGGGRRPNPLVPGCYGGGTLGFRHCRWYWVMWGCLGCSRAVKHAGGSAWRCAEVMIVPVPAAEA